MSYNKELPEDFTVTAHTGCMNTKANTVESMEAGFSYGADIIEIDIRFLPDGTPVLTHNALKTEEYASAARLKDAFVCLKDNPGKKANLDIKCTDNLKEIERLAEETGVLESIFFTGINKGFVAAVKKDCPKIPYYLNEIGSGILNKSGFYIKHLIKEVKSSGAIGINMNKNLASEKLINEFRKNGLLSSVWTITNEEDAAKYLKMSPDNITCKNPDTVIRLAKG